jgi:hypothetical protein
MWLHFDNRADFISGNIETEPHVSFTSEANKVAHLKPPQSYTRGLAVLFDEDHANRLQDALDFRPSRRLAIVFARLYNIRTMCGDYSCSCGEWRL